jgi:Ni,Fe-hydrogenase maturation factor
VLVLGLGSPVQGNEGIGGRLVRSLFASFSGVDVRPASDFHGFSELLDEYDLIIVVKSLAYCGHVGHVSTGSSYALNEVWGHQPERAADLASAVGYARLMGHTLPRIEVINICIGTDEWPERGLSPTVAAMYRGIVGRVRSLVKDIIRQAELDAKKPFG